MKKVGFFLLVCLVFFPPDLLITQGLLAAETDNEWVNMPEGARSAYMGINGGTMPVSLLVSRDGSSLFTFVGRTGNDFLAALREANQPLPSFGNSTLVGGALKIDQSTGLFAGNATASLPVISLSGQMLSEPLYQELVPFGLSPEPLSIEGEVSPPSARTSVKKYRLFLMPDYFQPRRQSH